MKAIERLEQLLNDADERNIKLEEELESMRYRLESERWELARDTTDDTTLPRLEFAWTPSKHDGWRDYKVEYRLVRAHLLGHAVITPLGCTTSRGGMDIAPWVTSTCSGLPSLPFRDGAHAHHDAVHLGLPLYAITPTGAIRLDGEAAGYPSQRAEGASHRREPNDLCKPSGG
jgi:hypothetical protein